MVALPAFSLEKNIIIKEITNGYYSLGEYVLTTALMQAPVIVVCGLLSSFGPYWFLDDFGGINPSVDRYVQYWFILSLHLYVVESFALLIAVFVPNFTLGIIAYS